MEVLSRIFQNKTFSFNCGTKGQKKDFKLGEKDSFGPNNVRLVVFRDHDIKGRFLIFDSKVINRVGDGQSSSRRKSKDSGTSCTPPSTGQPPPDGAKHTPMKQLSDTNVFEKMMFGSVAMAYKGSTLKIHTIRSPPQIIITKIFVPVRSHRDAGGTGSSGDTESFDNCSYQSSSSIYTYDGSTPRDVSSPHSAPLMCHSVPMAVPTPPPPQSLDEPSAETGDSGIAGSMTSSYSSHTTPYPSPGSSASTGSNSYLHRRFIRSQNTSLELHVRTKLSDDAIEKPLPASKRPSQFGIGIIFNLPEGQDEKNRDFQSFLFSHIMLIEGHVNKLRYSLEKALKTKAAGFHIATLDYFEVFRRSVFELYLAPRLEEPVWLAMMSGNSQKVKLCKTFLKDFMMAVDKYNTKATKMFLSTVITAVLRHHLAWVPTVAPAGGTTSRTYLDKHSAKWLDTLAKSHPYNPLWAQLGDLYGAIGYPLRLSRTLVIGKKQDVVKRFLYILSYFIRCSEVYETSDSSREWRLDTLDQDEVTGSPKKARSSEISIPQGASRHQGSCSSAPGLCHSPFNSCSHCGSVIENFATRGSYGRQASDVCAAGVTHSPGSGGNSAVPCSRPRICSTHTRIKSPSPVFESCETCSEVAVSEHKQSDLANIQNVLENTQNDVENAENNLESTRDNLESTRNNLESTQDDKEREIVNASSSRVKKCARCKQTTKELPWQSRRPPDMLFRHLDDITMVTDLMKDSDLYNGEGKVATDREALNNEIKGKQQNDNGESLDNCESLDNNSNATRDMSIVHSNELSISQKPPASDFGCLAATDVAVVTAADSVSRVYSDSCVPCATSTARKRLYPTLDTRTLSDGHQRSENENFSKTNSSLYPDLKLLKKIEGLSTPEDSPEKLFPSVFTSDAQVSVIGDPGFETREVTDSGCVTVGQSTFYVQLEEKFYESLFEKDEFKDCDLDKSKLEETELVRVKIGQTADDLEDKSDQDITVIKCHRQRDDDIFDVFSEGRKQQLSPIAEPSEETKIERIRNVGRMSSEVTQEESVDEVLDKRHIPGKLPHRDSGFSIDLISSSKTEDSNPQPLNSTGDETKFSHQIDSGVFDSGESFTNIHDEKAVRPVAGRLKKSNPNGGGNKTGGKRKSKQLPASYDRSVSMESQTSQSSFMEIYGSVACPDMQELEKFSQLCVTTETDSNPSDSETTPVPIQLRKPTFTRMVSGASEFNEYFNGTEEDGKGKEDSVVVYDLVNGSMKECVATASTDQVLATSQSLSQSTDPSTVPSQQNNVFSPTQNNDVFSPSHHDVFSLSDQLRFGDLLQQLPQEVDKSVLLDRVAAEPAAVDDYEARDQLTLSQSSQGSQDSLSRELQHSYCDDFHHQHGAQCSVSMAGSDAATDLDGSMCSEGTLRTDRSNSFSVTKQHRRKSSYHRTTSVPSAGTPGRCRSVTPTELGRRRHASLISINTIEANDAMDTVSKAPEQGLENISMPRSESDGECKENVTPQKHNFGHSLLAGFSPHYLSDFALHGTSDPTLWNRLHQDLTMSVQKPVLEDEHIAETACVVADTDKWSVKVSTCHINASDRVKDEEVVASKLVSEIIDSVYNLWKLKMSPEFCLMHLEDRLQEVYFKSKMLSEHLRFERKVNLKELAAMLGFDPSDLPLLQAVAGTHTPTFRLGLIP